MPGDLFDVLLVVAALLSAVAGYRRGLLVGVLSLAGLVAGAVAGLRVAPALARTDALAQLPPTAVALVAVAGLAVAGQLLLGAVAVRLRAGLTWRPVRLLDAVAGGAAGVVGLLLVAWLLATAVATSPYPLLASQVRRSTVIGAVDGLAPPAARDPAAGLRRLFAAQGLPDPFAGLDPTVPAAVPAPDDALAAGPAVTATRASVVKVRGVASACSRSIEGSGFVYAPRRVMTNAHVVAGVSAPVVEAGGRDRPARVVLYDARRDVAVLDVPGLRAPPLGFAPAAAPGADAVVVGYPRDGPLRADAARVRSVARVRGADIYDQGTVVRQVYALFTTVQPGNSGGPLLDPQGRVLGVVFAAAADRTDTGYALTAAEVAADAAQGRTAVAPVGTGGCD